MIRLRICALVLSVSCVCSCSTTRRMRLDACLPVSDSTASPSKKLKVVGYTSPDGRAHDFEGYVSVLSADSLRFVSHVQKEHWAGYRDPRARGGDSPTAGLSNASFDTGRDKIQTLFVEQSDGLGTAMVVLGVVTVTLGGLIGLVAATWEQ